MEKFYLKKFPEEYSDIPSESNGKYIPISRDVDGKLFRIDLNRLALEIGISSMGGSPIQFEGNILPSLNNEGDPLKKGDWTMLTPGDIYTNIGGG